MLLLPTLPLIWYNWESPYLSASIIIKVLTFGISIPVSIIVVHNKISNSEHVFVGRFVTDDEYQQMIKSRKSDISILLEDVDREYEHLKELNKWKNRKK